MARPQICTGSVVSSTLADPLSLPPSSPAHRKVRPCARYGLPGDGSARSHWRARVFHRFPSALWRAPERVVPGPATSQAQLGAGCAFDPSRQRCVPLAQEGVRPVLGSVWRYTSLEFHPAARMRRHEAHVPAQQPSACPYARLPHADEYSSRSRRHRRAPGQGPQPTDRLTADSAVLPGYRRLRRSTDFRVVMRSGTRAASRTVVVHAHATGVDRPARAGFIVGRTVGPAVLRKRVTRRLRHIVAPGLASVDPGTDLVVRALPAAGESSATELARDVRSALVRAVARLGQRPGAPWMVSQ